MSAPAMSSEESKANVETRSSCLSLLWRIIPQDASGDLALTPLTSKLCSWCSVICIMMAVWAHCFCDYADTRPAVKDEDPSMVWFLQLTATLSLAGLFYEVSVAIGIEFIGLRAVFQEDLIFRRRLRLNRKMIFVLSFLTTIYHLMAFDYQYVHKGWLAEYHGGHQIVYSLRYIEWTCCAPVVLSVSGQLEHAPDGAPRNGLIPSSLLTGIYCIISWQGLVVKDFWVGWALITWAFVSYFVASVEQLAFAWHLKERGCIGLLRAGLLVYLVIMIGIYGIVFLLPIPGWISATFENKFYCIGDASFKLLTSMMLLASHDLSNLGEMCHRAETIVDDFACLMETASVPIFGVDPQGCINQWNKKAADLTGLSKASALGMPLNKLLTSARRGELEAMIRMVLAGEEPDTLEISLNPLDFEECTSKGLQMKKAMLVLSAAPMMNKVGIMTGVTFMGYDLTEIAAFQEAEVRKNRFMAVVSHELRSPLHGIIGLVESLCNSEKDEVRAKKMRMVTNCATRLLDLVVNIMEMASSLDAQKSGTASKQLCRDPVELPKILDEIVTLIKSSTDKRGKSLVKPDVELIYNVKAMPIIEADAYKCTQVFYNIITNACKFTMKGTVTVSSQVDSDNKWVEVSMTDTGIGVASVSLERIFEPFEQEDSSDGRCQEGIGLGLSIAKEVVERHGGRIIVESELGVGTTFLVRLPVVMAADTRQSRSQTPELETQVPNVLQGSVVPKSFAGSPSDTPTANDNPSRRPFVLSVDDDIVNQTVIQDVLKDKYDIHMAMDGHEALEYIKTCKVLPDVVLLDVMMPGISGIEVCRTVRQKLQMSEIMFPILMISASVMGTAIEEAFKAGCNDFVTKPLQKQVLMARIQSALNIKMQHVKEVASLALAPQQSLTPAPKSAECLGLSTKSQLSNSKFLDRLLGCT
ncbi:unnamed protein product [Polarella glacialis]|uniref:histidine kinase n=2 Tax=Polarella glacialis TaxID=89957 RepID=A0A813EWD5_POLGL|nr:unnamed protein product [Polarella glacialis]